MKKCLNLLLVMLLVFSIVGCSSKEQGKKNEGENTPTKEETKKDLSFDVIKKALENEGYTINQETIMAASMIGAESGVKYQTDKGNLEFYQFDQSSEAYKKAEANGIITMEGFGDFEVVVNHGFVMVKSADNEEAIKLFQAL